LRLKYSLSRFKLTKGRRDEVRLDELVGHRILAFANRLKINQIVQDAKWDRNV